MNDLINVALLLVGLVAAAWIAWRRGARVIAAVITLFALLPTLTLLRELPWPAYVVLAVALVGFGFIRIVLQPSELPETLHQIAKGLVMGYAARSLVAERFEDDWSKPVEQWRRELGLVHEASIDFDGWFRKKPAAAA